MEIMSSEKALLGSQFRKLLVQSANLKPEQVNNVVIRFVDERTTRATLKTEKADVQAIEDLFVLFLLQVGSGIEKYRKAVLDELGEQGAVGEEKWRIISARLAKFENATRGPGTTHEDDAVTKATTIRREHLYPQNLKDARRVFLKENNQEPELEDFSAAA